MINAMARVITNMSGVHIGILSFNNNLVQPVLPAPQPIGSLRGGPFDVGTSLRELERLYAEAR